MNFRKIFAICVFTSVLINCNSQTHEAERSVIIPTPSNSISASWNFILNKKTGIEYDERLKISANFLKEYIENGSKLKLRRNSKISFIVDETIVNPEGYSLEILPGTIKIKAKTDQGAFYAVQSLRQLLPPSFENGSFEGKYLEIKSIIITDAPQFLLLF